MRLLVIGNGFSRLINGGRVVLTKNTAAFLDSLPIEKFERIGFVQPVRKVVQGKTLNDAELRSRNVDVIGIPLFRLFGFFTAIIRVARYDFYYIFFPGTWPRIIGLFALFLGKPFGVYLRGEKFSNNGLDALLLRKAKFVCSVIGMEARMPAQVKKVIPISPMTDIGVADARAKGVQRDPREEISLIFVGRIEKEKGVQELIEAASLLAQERVKFSLKLVGVGPLLNDLRRLAEERELNNIEFLGLVSNRDELLRLYETSDVLVFPTYHEGFPRVLLEAMLKSCVVVTTFVGGIPSVMKAERNCLEIKVGCVSSIVDAIKRLSLNPSLEKELSEAARNAVLEILENRVDHVTAVCANVRGG